MINDNIYKRYVPGIVPPVGNNDSKWWFVFYSNKLLTINKGEGVSIPFVKDLEQLCIKPVRTQFLGMLDGYCCYSAEAETDLTTSADMAFNELRSLFDLLEGDIFLIAGRALQIVNWDQIFQYCGRCGTHTETKQNERAKVCPKCSLTSYPRISPAVITAIIKGNQILLAHASHFKTNMYSIIAGFVEPGETLEDCVKREVMEEVGISVKNIKYFGSQPWPFPDSLMLGFTAEYADGEITPDGVEISDAGWYTSGNLPEIPSKISISRKLIDWFIENYK